MVGAVDNGSGPTYVSLVWFHTLCLMWVEFVVGSVPLFRGLSSFHKNQHF